VNFVLDTNAVSETAKPRPDPGFMAWHDAQDPAHLFITVTLAEVWHGFHCLEPSHPDYDRIKKFATDLHGNIVSPTPCAATARPNTSIWSSNPANASTSTTTSCTQNWACVIRG